jgi:hypothetical protein
MSLVKQWLHSLSNKMTWLLIIKLMLLSLLVITAYLKSTKVPKVGLRFFRYRVLFS